MASNPKTIVLWGRGDLLSSSVELILTAQEGWEVVTVPFEDDPGGLLQAVDDVEPDVVIIQGEEHGGHPNVAVLLQGHPTLPVITLNPNDNLMEMYSVRNIAVQSAADLISVIGTAIDGGGQA
jgi:hypothetical protein